MILGKVCYMWHVLTFVSSVLVKWRPWLKHVTSHHRSSHIWSSQGREDLLGVKVRILNKKLWGFHALGELRPLSREALVPAIRYNVSFLPLVGLRMLDSGLSSSHFETGGCFCTRTDGDQHLLAPAFRKFHPLYNCRDLAEFIHPYMSGPGSACSL